MRKDMTYSLTNKFVEFIMLVLVVSLTLAIVDDSHAQRKKKKGKNNGEVDDAAAKQAHMRELLKSWSFGYENYKNKQYESAKKHFWKVTELDTINKFKARTYRYLGNSYMNTDDPDSAQVIFEMGSAKFNDDPWLHRMVGYLLSNRGLIVEGIARYEKVVELQPDAVDDWMQLASLYSREDRNEDAIAAYDKILAIEPNNVEAQEKKTALIAMTGDIGDLIAEKEKVKAANSENSRVRFDLGKLYFDRGEEGDYEKSIERFQEFLALSPNDVPAMEYIGSAYGRLGQHSKAIAQYKAILEVQPENKKAMAEISWNYKDMGRFSSARAYARRALAVDNSYGYGWIALGKAYEASAEKCVSRKDGKVDFNDKLAYELAAVQYRKARKDLEFRQDAERHLNFLVPVLPTKEDKFMHKGQTKASGECYKWIY